MRRSFAVRFAARLLECLLPRDLSEVVVGDLYEELAIRERTVPRARACIWFMGQVARSLPRLMIFTVDYRSWLKSLAVAAVAFLVLRQIEPPVHRWLGKTFEPGVNTQLLVSMLIGFASCACGGFLATWMHRGSALIYSAIGTSVLVFAIARVDVGEPLWIPASFVLIAMIAPIIGGVGFITLAGRRRRRVSLHGGNR